MKKFDFNELFIYDLANNHQGDLEHGMNIINALGNVTRDKGIKAALKFQFRQLDTFIHPEFKDKKDIKHIPRFMSTALSIEDYKTLTEAVRDNGMLTICTPFDEESVDVILDMGIKIIKVASCSAIDRPLLERIAQANKPVVVSTGGLSHSKIDRLVSFLEYNGVDFALMHCVALYPTPNDKLNLNQIGQLRNRFPHIPIGFSTHEEPENYDAIRIAYAKGASIFERHVGMETEKHKLNTYSSKPDQISRWIDSYKDSVAACGCNERSPADLAEIDSLKSLIRGVFFRKKIKKGQLINREDVFFAMPLQENQLTSGEWFKGLKADQDYEPNQALNETLADLGTSKEESIFRIMLQAKGLLNKARVFIGKDSSIEISHHLGLKRFREFGAVIIDCINRNYCKKIIVLLPRQQHPYHYHKIKEETFQLLSGDMDIELQGNKTQMQVGDTFLVKPGQWHKFNTLAGAILEEVSTTHYDNDSFYEDERIARMPRGERKTKISNWEIIQRQAAEHN